MNPIADVTCSTIELLPKINASAFTGRCWGGWLSETTASVSRRRKMKFPVRRQWLSEESPMIAISSTFTTEVSALGGLCMSLCMSIARMNRGRARAKRD